MISAAVVVMAGLMHNSAIKVFYAGPSRDNFAPRTGEYPWTTPKRGGLGNSDRELILSIRRNRRDPKERAFYLTFTPAGSSLADLAGAALLRWSIDECFQRAKEALSLIIAKPAAGTAGIVTCRCAGGWRLSGASTVQIALCCKRQTEQNESAARRLIPYRLLLPSVPEMRAMIAKLLLRPPLRRRFLFAWSD